MVISHVVSFHDSIIWMRCFAAMDLHEHSILFDQKIAEQSQAQQFYKLWKSDI